MTTLNYGDRAARLVSQRIAQAVDTLTTLKSTPKARRNDGQIVQVLADGSLWTYLSTSVLAGDDLLVSQPSDAIGAWLRMPGEALIAMPIGFATADAAIMLTVPTGCVIQPLEFAWKVTTSFTGGTSSAIGVSSSTVAGHTTKGDLLGGAAGDVAATLVSTTGEVAPGTIGTNWATVANRRVFMKPTDTLRFDRVTSAFTAGAGFAFMACNVLKNAGA